MSVPLAQEVYESVSGIQENTSCILPEYFLYLVCEENSFVSRNSEGEGHKPTDQSDPPFFMSV